MKRISALAILTLLLAACVDTTGISAQSGKPPKGNSQAVVVVSEYTDLECPSCRAAYDAIVKPLIEKYETQVRFDYRHFPLRSIHRYTMELAEAAECAADQGKFWEFVDSAFEKQSQLAKGKAAEWGEVLVENDELFSRCVRSHIKKDAIMAEYEEGIARGVAGTPTFFVQGARVESSLDALSAAIGAQLKGAGQRL